MCNTTQTLITAVYNTVEMYTTKNVLEVVLLAKLLVCHFINRYNVELQQQARSCKISFSAKQQIILALNPEQCQQIK